MYVLLSTVSAGLTMVLVKVVVSFVTPPPTVFVVGL